MKFPDVHILLRLRHHFVDISMSYSQNTTPFHKQHYVQLCTVATSTRGRCAAQPRRMPICGGGLAGCSCNNIDYSAVCFGDCCCCCCCCAAFFAADARASEVTWTDLQQTEARFFHAPEFFRCCTWSQTAIDQETASEHIFHGLEVLVARVCRLGA